MSAACPSTPGSGLALFCAAETQVVLPDSTKETPQAKRKRQGLEVIEKLQATELPSASNIARHPKDFMKFTQKCPLYMHRPCGTFTIPLTAMFRAFGEFQEIFHEGLPTPEDCRLAMRLCEISSKIHKQEVQDLQSLIHTLLSDSLPYTFISSQPAESQPDERIQHHQADIGGVALKTDSGGNTYGQCQRYYVAQVLALRAAGSPFFSHSCIPCLWLEISCATLRVCAAGFFSSRFAFEPLTTAIHLHCINDPQHVLSLARCCSAVRKTLVKLANLYDSLASRQALSGGLQHASTAIPYHISHLYPGAVVDQLMSPQRLVFLVTPSQPSPLLVVKLILQGADTDGPAGIHASWADADLAPKQVHCTPLPHKLLAVGMDYLDPLQWVPMALLAPVRSEGPSDDVPVKPLSHLNWEAAAELARDALRRAHLIRFPAGSPAGLPTVHGDMRLPNILAHLAQDGKVDAIKFLDFDWAGVEGRSRYPVLMNPAIHWPIGASPQMPMSQAHDTALLEGELARGRGEAPASGTASPSRPAQQELPSFADVL